MRDGDLSMTLAGRFVMAATVSVQESFLSAVQKNGIEVTYEDGLLPGNDGARRYIGPKRDGAVDPVSTQDLDKLAHDVSVWGDDVAALGVRRMHVRSGMPKVFVSFDGEVACWIAYARLLA